MSVAAGGNHEGYIRDEEYELIAARKRARDAAAGRF